MISAIDFDQMWAAIQNALQTLEAKSAADDDLSPVPRLLIIEGILVMNVAQLYHLMDLKFYLTLSKEECLRRRLLRNYDPPDVAGRSPSTSTQMF